MITRIERDAPVPAKIAGTLLDTVPVTEGDVGGPDVVGLYTSVNCMVTDTVTDMCPDDPAPKDFNGPQLISGIRFPVYSGFVCRLVGMDFSDMQQRVEKVVEVKESYAVEKALMQTRFTGLGGGSAATIITTPGTDPPCPEVGLAYLEEDAATHYAGVPVIHAPRMIGSLLVGVKGTLIRNGDAFKTGLGSDFVAGAGYWPNNGPDPDDPPAEGEAWMFATGVVRITRGKRMVRSAVDQLHNEGYILSERVYVADVDCYLAAVKVKIA